MGDKDLLVVIAEMLKKQDRQSELIEKTNSLIHKTNALTQETNALTQETNTTLKQFMEISIKQFEQQQQFNEKAIGRLSSIEKLLLHVVDIEDRVKRLEAAVFK